MAFTMIYGLIAIVLAGIAGTLVYRRGGLWRALLTIGGVLLVLLVALIGVMSLIVESM